MSNVPPSPLSPVRTADGRYAPYAARVLMTTSMATTTAQPPPPPYLQPQQPAADSEPIGAAHASLYGSCAFIRIPQGLESVVIEDAAALSQALNTPSAMPQPLFVGQLRFECTAGELHWLLHHLTGVLALKIEPRGPGCFVVVLKSNEDADKVLQLHRRALFDHCGVWYASNPQESFALESYLRCVGPQLSRRSRLPRDTMIVERQKGSLNPLRTILGLFGPSSQVRTPANQFRMAQFENFQKPDTNLTGGVDGRLRCESGDSNVSSLGLSSAE